MQQVGPLRTSQPISTPFFPKIYNPQPLQQPAGYLGLAQKPDLLGWSKRSVYQSPLSPSTYNQNLLQYQHLYLYPRTRPPLEDTRKCQGPSYRWLEMHLWALHKPCLQPKQSRILLLQSQHDRGKSDGTLGELHSITQNGKGSLKTSPVKWCRQGEVAQASSGGVGELGNNGF